MKYLTAVLNESEIQNYISKNEDSAFEYLKNNFKIENIYESIISNINNFISHNIDLEISYESIKEYSRNYTLQILIEGFAEDILSKSRDSIESTIKELPSVKEFTIDKLNSMISEFSSKLNISKEDAAKVVEYVKTNGIVDEDKIKEFASKFPKLNISPKTQETFVNWVETQISNLGIEADKYWKPFKTFIDDNPPYTVPAAVIALIGITYLIFKKKK